MSPPPTIARSGATFPAQITKRVWYPQAPEAVWAALTDPAALAEWLMPNDFRPVVGHEFRFTCDPCPGPIGAVTRCQVLELEAPRRMLWSWHMDVKPGLRPAQPMLVEWTLEPERGGTRLVLKQSAYDGPRGLVVRFMMSIGWRLMLRRLLPKVIANVQGGTFTPGAIPLAKRAYRVTRTPQHQLTGLTY